MVIVRSVCLRWFAVAALRIYEDDGHSSATEESSGVIARSHAATTEDFPPLFWFRLVLEGVSSFTTDVEKQTNFCGFFGNSTGFWVLLVGCWVFWSFWGVRVGLMVCYTNVRVNEHTHTDRTQKLTRITDIKHTLSKFVLFLRGFVIIRINIYVCMCF